MSAQLCQKVECALLRWIMQRSTAETAVTQTFGHFESSTDVETQAFGKHVLANYTRFSLNYYTGSSEDAVHLPAIVVTCSDAREDEFQRGLFMVDCQVDLEVSADSDPAGRENPTTDAGEFLAGVSVWLGELLQASRIQDELDATDMDFICNGRTQISSQRSVQGRRHVHRNSFALSCSYGN